MKASEVPLDEARFETVSEPKFMVLPVEVNPEPRTVTEVLIGPDEGARDETTGAFAEAPVTVIVPDMPTPPAAPWNWQ